MIVTRISPARRAKILASGDMWKPYFAERPVGHPKACYELTAPDGNRYRIELSQLELEDGISAIRTNLE